MILKLVAETTKVWHGEEGESHRKFSASDYKILSEGVEGRGRMESGLPHKFTLTVASGVFDIPLGWEATIDTQYDFGVTVDNHHVRCGAMWSGVEWRHLHY